MKQATTAWAGCTLAILTLTLTAGCASQQRETLPSDFHEWAYTQARTTDVPAGAHDHLDEASPGERVSFGNTPWGENTQFAIDERYFAASGRPCFRGRLSYQAVDEQSAGQRVDNEAAVVCRYSASRWVASRAVAEKINVVDHAAEQSPGTGQ